MANSGARQTLRTSVNSNYGSKSEQADKQAATLLATQTKKKPISAQPHSKFSHASTSSTSTIASSSSSLSADQRQARHAKLASAAIAFASLELSTNNHTSSTATHYKSPTSSVNPNKPQTLESKLEQQQQVAVDRQLLQTLANQRLSTGAPATTMVFPSNNKHQQHNPYGSIPLMSNSDIQATQIYGYTTSDLSSSAGGGAGGEAQDYSSDHHYYQVVVPQQTTNQNTTTNHNLQHIQTLRQHDTHTLEANLVNSEPLIRSCSWRNKTLINLNNQPSGNYYYRQQGGVEAEEQPRYAPFSPIPIELGGIQQHQQQHHLAAYYNQTNSLLDRHLATKRAAQMSSQRSSTSSKRLPFAFLSTRLFLLLLLLAASTGLFLVALLSNKLPVNKVHEPSGASPISPNEPYMHRQLMGLPTLSPTGAPIFGPHQPAQYNLTPPPSGQSNPPSAPSLSSSSLELPRINTPTPKPNSIQQNSTQNSLQPPNQAGYVQLPAPAYWHQTSDDAGSFCNPSSQSACNLQGLCINRVCRCFAGYSGPTCARVDCPEDCSLRGSCQLRSDKPINQLISPTSSFSNGQHMQARISSLAFSSLTSARHLSSMCPHNELDNSNSSLSDITDASDDLSEPRTYDNRLEWQCKCRTGFAGAKCERLEELDCANNRDDDNDGLVDCDDDDCCSQPACSQIFVCITSPEPQLVLEQLAATSGLAWSSTSENNNNNNKQEPLPIETTEIGQLFYAQMRFLIANKSMQSYVHENAFEPSRVAVIRGKVVKWSTPEGIVSVRVAVVENERLGFTLTRHDGSFDLLVNGNEWITLELHKNAYTPLKHRIFVRPLAINQLHQELVMWPASTSSSLQQQRLNHFGADFGTSAMAELHQLAWSVTPKDDPKRANLLQCLLNVARSSQNTDLYLDMAQAKPRFVKGVARETDFVLVSGEASYETSIKFPHPSPIEFAYNSAMFPPAASLVKSHLVVQLLEQQRPLPPTLSSILIQFDVEGQMKSERLKPISGLTYQFAWNRRNVYQQKVYGFAQLIVRIGYQFSTANSTYPLWLDCLAGHQVESSAGGEWGSKWESSPANLAATRTVWFERRLHLEAHQLNHHSELGKWQLPAYNRFDLHRQLIYFGAGWTLPFRLAYPPVVSEALPLFPLDTARRLPGTRAMTHGPPDSMFMILESRLIQLDVSGGWPAMHRPHRRLIDVPLATLTSKLGLQNPQAARLGEPTQDDLQLIYNNHQSMLYVSSRSAAKIVQVSLSGLLVLNKTQTGHSPTSAPEDEIDIEPLCGFGRHALSLEGEPVRLARSVRLTGPNSLTLDEQRQILYFIDGASSFMALELQTRRLTLLQALLPQHKFNQDFKATGTCSHFRIHWNLFNPVKLTGLRWARSQSALVFIDQNTVFSLGQDMFVRVLATGYGSPYQGAEECIKQPELGEIKMLLIDDNTDNLFIVHQWQARQMVDTSKQEGRFYLAKLKLGITQSASNTANFVDLHSAISAWDPTINQLAMRGNKTTINWHEISSSPQQLIAERQSAISQQVNSSGQSTTIPTNRAKIPFIHLQNGFERIDSIEINSDGSIFVLDSDAISIRMIAAYSPSNFNLIERHDVNINRLFVTNSQSTQYYSSLYAPLTRQPLYYANQTRVQSEEKESHKLNVLIIQSPIGGQVLEFHSTTGFQLASFTKTTTTSAGNEYEDNLSTSLNDRRLEFYYRIISPTSRMIEDDANDFQAIKFAQNYKVNEFYSSNQQQNKRTNMKLSNYLGPGYVRLNKIYDINNGDTYELQRDSQSILQSIILNDQPTCELSTDFKGVLKSLQLLQHDFRCDLVYEENMYLLREIATQSNLQQLATRQLSDSNDHEVHIPIKNWRQLKRIAYDNLFHHYCDLIIANL